ncbi:hypothetical protein EVAR_53432_1 [Eumeta japonica]|uniref:Uncharacterized protein n=1 Tax=Eumeta variegata TaxID=151549 RepID=A0A4C1Y4P1_EUMVA|nr:hypothetical protein EVAR_53432_1 [Eumeta japonica]
MTPMTILSMISSSDDDDDDDDDDDHSQPTLQLPTHRRVSPASSSLAVAATTRPPGTRGAAGRDVTVLEFDWWWRRALRIGERAGEDATGFRRRQQRQSAPLALESGWSHCGADRKTG